MFMVEVKKHHKFFFSENFTVEISTPVEYSILPPQYSWFLGHYNILGLGFRFANFSTWFSTEIFTMYSPCYRRFPLSPPRMIENKKEIFRTKFFKFFIHITTVFFKWFEVTLHITGTILGYLQMVFTVTHLQGDLN